jgi:hypothetical protein
MRGFTTVRDMGGPSLGTYVAAHAYTTVSIQRAIAAGVKVIEHGHLMDEATARLMAEKGIWLSTQPFVDLGGAAALSAQQQARMKQVIGGTETVYMLAKKYKIKTAFGTDIIFSGRSTDYGDVNEWRTTGAVRSAQSLSRQNRRHRTRRACRSSARGWRSAQQYRARR